MEKTRLGPVFFVFGVFLTLILTMALVFLGMIAWENISVIFIVGWGGGMLCIAVFGQVGYTKAGPLSPLVFVATGIGFIAMIVENGLVGVFFGVQSVDPANGVFINFLSAMYEETFFLGIDCAGRAGNLPGPARLLLSAGVFLPLHAFRYPIDMLMYVFLLLVVRMTLDTVRIMSNHSDPPFIVHGLWNVLASLFGGV